MAMEPVASSHLVYLVYDLWWGERNTPLLWGIGPEDTACQLLSIWERQIDDLLLSQVLSFTLDHPRRRHGLRQATGERFT